MCRSSYKTKGTYVIGKVMKNAHIVFPCSKAAWVIVFAWPPLPNSVFDSQNHLCWGVQKRFSETSGKFVKTCWDRGIYLNRFFENVNRLSPSCWRIVEWLNSSYLQIVHISTYFWLFVWLNFILLNDALSSADFLAPNEMGECENYV
jgi:hypothetical protein